MNAKSVRPLTPHHFFLFVTFCAFSWLTNSAALAKEPVAPAAKKPTGPARFETEIAAFEKWDAKNAVPKDSILFVGSSSVRLWESAEAFPGLPVINRGFGGSTIPDSTHFADRIIFKYKPRTIVFYAGDNDIAAGRSPDRVVTDYEAFAKAIHEKLPETRLIFVAIKPSVLRWKMWPKAQEVNARIEKLTKQNDHEFYVDIVPPMLDSDGQPRKELFRDDGLHMNPKGYEIWNKALAPVLSDLAKSL